MSVLERCPSYRESNKGSKERQGPNLECPFYRGVRLIGSLIGLQRCPLRESRLNPFTCRVPLCALPLLSIFVLLSHSW